LILCLDPESLQNIPTPAEFRMALTSFDFGAMLQKRFFRTAYVRTALGLLIILLISAPCFSQVDIEAPPINYSETKADNAVTRVIDQIKSGGLSLDYDQDFGYLPALLQAMDVPVSSQGLVFSKTSMQIQFISPQTPRAVYFNDDIYIGWVKGSNLMEISTADPKLGAAFYLVEMNPEKAIFKQAYYNCLTCHTSTLTQGVPGHTVRSVVPQPNGYIVASKKSYVSDHCSPLEERWGGWYVTGRHGEMRHMGNAVLRGEHFTDEDTRNWLTLNKVLETTRWLSSRSDIVALMVLEHQTQMHNTFTRANFEVRRRLYEIDQAFPETEAANSKTVGIEEKRDFDFAVDDLAEQVVDYMLFVDETKIDSKIKGSSKFVREFVARGPSDSQGRTLREFDLRSRIFRYPCSYLIYSTAFDALETPLQNKIYRRLWRILTQKDVSTKYNHLDTETRQAILSILRETKTDLPDYWQLADDKRPAAD
jgi:hypothetical protein